VYVRGRIFTKKHRKSALIKRSNTKLIPGICFTTYNLLLIGMPSLNRSSQALLQLKPFILRCAANSLVFISRTFVEIEVGFNLICSNYKSRHWSSSEYVHCLIRFLSGVNVVFSRADIILVSSLTQLFSVERRILNSSHIWLFKACLEFFDGLCFHVKRIWKITVSLHARKKECML